MADKDKSQEKSKSSFFRSKNDGKKESKKNKSSRKRRGSKKENAEDIGANITGLENVKENLTKPSNSNTDCVSTKSNDEIPKAEEVSVSSTTTDSKTPDNSATNLEEISSDKPVAETIASEEQHATDEVSENAETSAVLDGKAQPDKPELAGVVEQAGFSGEQGETQGDNNIKQTEADVENKASEVTAAGGSKKHGKASGPLASFRRHKKKNKLSKHLQDAANVEKSEGNLNESKDGDHSEQPESVDKSSSKTAEPKTGICKEGEEQIDSSETSNSAVNVVELKEKTAEIPEIIASSTSEMVNDKSEEQGTTKKGHKEKKSGPFASFRKSKKKSDSAKQPNTSSENGQNKPEDVKNPVESAKEVVAVNVPKVEEEKVLVLDKEMTGKQQQTNADEQQQPAEPESNTDNLPAQESKATEEQANLNDELSDDEKNTEEKHKKGKRFGSFSGFSRAKKAPKLSQKTAQPQPQIDSKEKDMADSSSKDQADGKTDMKDILSGKETREGDNSSEHSKNKELAAAEVCKDLPSGSELQVQEMSAATGSETTTADERKEQQEELGTTQEKKKSGLKKRISKLRLNSGKNKENQSKEGAKNRPEVDVKQKNPETGASGSEISTQVKRKKSGGLQKKISKALKRNKSGQMELNEMYDDPSASEEECHPLLDVKSPISPTAPETREETTELDGEKQKDQINESPDKAPEIVEEKEEQQIAEQSSSSTSDTATTVKRVTFSFDEETVETEGGEPSHDQPAVGLSNDEQNTAENTADKQTEQDEKRDKDGVTLGEEDSVTSEKEGGAFEIYGICRDIMKQVFVELFDYVATKMATQREDTENQELKIDEDLPKPTIAPGVAPSSNTLSVVQEMESGNLTESSDALSVDSLLSTGTVVLLESSDSELERVSPIPDELVSVSVEFDNDSDQTEKLQTFSSVPVLFVSESMDRDNDSAPQENQAEKTPENLEEQTAETEEMVAGKRDEEPIQVDDAAEVPGSSETSGSEDISQKHSENSAPSSEIVEPENGPATDEDRETQTDVPENEASCSPEKGEVDRAAETSVEQSIERNLERSLETSLQCLLSQSLKEEWIIVRPRLEISQEMSNQFKAFALESYAQTRAPVCCKMM